MAKADRIVVIVNYKSTNDNLNISENVEFSYNFNNFEFTWYDSFELPFVKRNGDKKGGKSTKKYRPEACLMSIYILSERQIKLNTRMAG